MGKKHKKHKAEWRSSYEGAEPAGGVWAAGTGGDGVPREGRGLRWAGL